MLREKNNIEDQVVLPDIKVFAKYQQVKYYVMAQKQSN